VNLRQRQQAGRAAPRQFAASAQLRSLPLCGANGLVVCMAMAPWGLYVGIVAPRLAAGRRPMSYRVLAIAAGLGVILTAVYFVGYERPSWVPSSPGLWQSVTTSGKIAALAWGPAGLVFWPLFALLATLVAGSACGPLLIGGWRAWRAGNAQSRATVLGLAAGPPGRNGQRARRIASPHTRDAAQRAGADNSMYRLGVPMVGT
jgi:hypothetical protein